MRLTRRSRNNLSQSTRDSYSAHAQLRCPHMWSRNKINSVLATVYFISGVRICRAKAKAKTSSSVGGHYANLSCQLSHRLVFYARLSDVSDEVCWLGL